MIDILLIICMVFLVIPYTRIMLIYFKTKKIESDDITGFDLTKELTSNYDEINIVESKEINISTDFDKTNAELKVQVSVTTRILFWIIAAISALLGFLKLQSKEREKYER